MTTATSTVGIPSVQWLAQLGGSLTHRGLDDNLPSVRGLVRSARGLGIAPVLCQVALDPGAPTAVRERAVAQLIRRVARVSELRVIEEPTDERSNTTQESNTIQESNTTHEFDTNTGNGVTP